MARPRGKKRTAAEAAADESSNPEAAVKEPASRGRGRPKKAKVEGAESSNPEAAVKEPASRGRRRPKKAKVEGAESSKPEAAVKKPAVRGRGRPKKDKVEGAESSKPEAAVKKPAARGQGRPKKDKVEGAESSEPASRGRGRPKKAKAAADESTKPESAAAAAAAAESSKPEAAVKEPAARGRRKVFKLAPKPNAETEYIPDKRNLEDLWLSAFPVGTEWENIDKIKEFNWNFENLEKTLEEGGELYGKTVYLFGSTEPQLLDVNGESKIVLIPVVVAVDCPFPPSDKIGINSVQRENEEIVPMQAMKMAWVPYVPLEDRNSRIDSLETKIFTLGCTQRRSALKHLKTERVKKFDYCMPYFMPLNPPEEEDDTVVNIIYPLEPPIVCDFDWEMDDYEDFADEKVKDEVLLEDEKEKFKEFVKERVRERKRELKQAKEARKKAIDDMDPKTKEAYENIKFYKFYPVKTPDTPDVSNVKAKYINRYYRNAHYLM